MELCRVVAMFLVLLVHTGNISLGAPTHESVCAAPLAGFLRFFTQSLSIVCVDVFVMISGWFGINARRSGVFKFVYQYAFFVALLFIVVEPLRGNGIPWLTIVDHVVLSPKYWFFKAYLLLYFLAPVLNSFAKTASTRLQLNVLIGFFAFQTLYDWCGHGLPYIINGYSPVSFIGLYLLMRYIRLHQPKWAMRSKSTYLLLFFASVLFVALSVFAFSYVSDSSRLNPIVCERMIGYTAPFTIVESACLILYFSKLQLQNKFINWLGASCFAVYLLHCHPLVFEPVFQTAVVRLYESFSLGAYYPLMFVGLVAVYLACIVIDQLRIWSYKCLSRHIQLLQ